MDDGHLNRESDADYLVSVSDVMAGLLFVFIITIVVFALMLRQREDEAQAERDRLTGAGTELAGLLDELQGRLSNEGIVVQVNSRAGVLHLGEQLLFPSGRAVLGDVQRSNVQVIARILADVLPCYAAQPPGFPATSCGARGTRGRIEAVFIEGHTDDRLPTFATTGFRDNMDLSLARAKTIFEEVRLTPIAGTTAIMDTLKNDVGELVLSLSAYAERRPVEPLNATEEQRLRNRRIDLRFIMRPPIERSEPTGQKPEPQVHVEEALASEVRP